LAWKRHLTDRETNTSSNIYSHMFTNPSNLMKVCLVILRSLCSKRSLKKEKKKES